MFTSVQSVCQGFVILFEFSRKLHINVQELQLQEDWGVSMDWTSPVGGHPQFARKPLLPPSPLVQLNHDESALARDGSAHPGPDGQVHITPYMHHLAGHVPPDSGVSSRMASEVASISSQTNNLNLGSTSTPSAISPQACLEYMEGVITRISKEI